MSTYGRHPYATDAIRPSPRKTPKRPLNTTPPRCDTCRKQLAPGVDHSTCKEKP